jgi:hypothetical protein
MKTDLSTPSRNVQRAGGVSSSSILQAMKISDALKSLGRPVVFYPRLAEVFGIQESIFISHFVYWSDKSMHPDGWIYKDRKEILEETGLSYEQQRRVRRVLTASTKSLKGHHKTARAVTEPVLQEMYDRPTHTMFFRIDKEALDRVFSQGQLFPILAGQLGKPQVPPRRSLSGSRGKSNSSITESTTQSTTYISAPRAAGKRSHAEFVKWYAIASVKIRGKEPTWNKSDFRNLMIALRMMSVSQLESMALFFLADSMFKEYDFSLHVFLSKGVMKAIHSQNGFWPKVDGYYRQFFKVSGGAAEMLDDAGVKALTKKLAEKFSI